jgi:hypothetical protein
LSFSAAHSYERSDEVLSSLINEYAMVMGFDRATLGVNSEDFEIVEESQLHSESQKRDFER